MAAGSAFLEQQKAHSVTPIDDQRETDPPHDVRLQYDTRRMKLSGWAAPEVADHAADELILSLMAGDILLGTLRRKVPRPYVDAHLGYAGPPSGFSVSDFGLAAFARATGFRNLAIATGGRTVARARHPVPLIDRGHEQFDPFGSRGGGISGTKLTDVWLETSRDLSLRFEGIDESKVIDAYQCTPGADPIMVNLAANLPIGGLLSVAKVKLLNPFLPLLLVFKGVDETIDGIDIIPFPTLVRGGLHEAERLIAGDGSDDLTDTATVSGTLLHALLARSERRDGVARIVLDPAIHTGLEPVLNDDVLGWIGDFLEVSIRLSPPDGASLPGFIADKLARHAPTTDRLGHSLHLPADCIPTIAALVNGYPAGLAAQTVTGGMAVAEWTRHGRIWSIWQPSMGDWFEGLQGNAGRQFAPALEVPEDAISIPDGKPLALAWPLAIAIRAKSTRIGQQTPFEMAAEVALPLLRNGALPSGAGISALILCDRSDQSVLSLLESLARQQSVGIIDVIVSRTTAKHDPQLSEALAALFPDRYRLVAQPAAMGRLDRIKAVSETFAKEQVLILDAATILPDPRTIATLLPMLDAPDVATVGCLVRAAMGKPVSMSAGYSPTAVDFRAVPALSFRAIDPVALRQPATYAVIANTTAALITTRELLRDILTHGSVALRPDIDDLLLGLQIVDQGGHNLCTTLVSVYSDREPAKATDLALSIPYRLSIEALGRIMTSTTIVQMIR